MEELVCDQGFAWKVTGFVFFKYIRLKRLGAGCDQGFAWKVTGLCV